jgi:hypothetical protein
MFVIKVISLPKWLYPNTTKNIEENMKFLVNLVATYITPVLATNMIMRKLSFQEHSDFVSEIDAFRYIHYYKYNNCHYIYWSLNRQLRGEEKTNLQIIRRVLVALFMEKRKIII